MFNQAIDAVQSGKKYVVNNFVYDDQVKADLNTLVDAQTKFYQGWVDTTLSLAQTLVSLYKNPFVKGAK